MTMTDFELLTVVLMMLTLVVAVFATTSRGSLDVCSRPIDARINAASAGLTSTKK